MKIANMNKPTGPAQRLAFASSHRWSSLAAMFVGWVTATASAQIIVDQSNPVTTGFVTNEVYSSSPTTFLSQSFIPTTTNIAGAYFEIYPHAYPSNPTDTLTVTLFAVNPAIDASNPMITGSTTILTGSGGGVSVYWSPIAVTPGNTYFLRVQNSVAGNQINLSGNEGTAPTGVDRYTNGAMWVDTSVWWGGGYTNWDLVFKTYTDTSPIPEPSACVALFGLVAVGFAAYRRRKGLLS